MKLTLKFLFLPLTLFLVIFVVFYTLHQTIKTSLTKELSSLFKAPVHIKSLKYEPLRTFRIEDITISDPQMPSKTSATIKEVSISFNTLAIIKNHQLRTTVSVKEFRAGDIFCEVQVKTVSKKASSLLRSLDLSLLDYIHVAGGKVSTNNFNLQDIRGRLTLGNLAIKSGVLTTSLDNKKYLMHFSQDKIKKDNAGYTMSILSNKLRLRNKLKTKDSKIIIKDLKGTLYALSLDLEGEIDQIFSAEPTYTLLGTVKTDLQNWDVFGGALGKFASRNSLSGTIGSNLFLRSKGMKPAKSEGKLTIAANSLKIRNFRINDISAKVYLENGRLNAPLINGTIYGSSFTSDFKMDFVEKNMPYMISFVTDNMNVGSAINDITGKNTPVYGNFKTDLTIGGYGFSPDAIEGKGYIQVTDGNLGPMPLLTPLVGNIFAAVSTIMPGVNMVAIKDAYADFIVKDRKILTNNLTLSGEDISITATGYVGFDSTLDFAFQNEIREPKADQNEPLQIVLKSTIVKFGKSISRANLRGTLAKPKWEMEYFEPIKNTLSKNIKGLLGVPQ
ncbi:MAG: AsmA-like C-terminal region-containing protein [Candidatus Omnitrophica bacterium]|nr:AsmA-like C-terminal region-containing protein [Candidatus Omnitrophota bacterium]